MFNPERVPPAAPAPSQERQANDKNKPNEEDKPSSSSQEQQSNAPSRQRLRGKQPVGDSPNQVVPLPLALRRVHEKLSDPSELLKLHLKHYHMSAQQFRRRTSKLKIPGKSTRNTKRSLRSAKPVLRRLELLRVRVFQVFEPKL